MICSIGEKQIEEVIKQKKYQKLVDLHDSNEVLEVEIPNIFNNQRNQAITTATLCEMEFTNSSDVRVWKSKISKNAVTLGSEQSLLKRQCDTRNNYYSLMRMLFPEVAGIPPLAILVMDTIFYNPDGSMTYVYTDHKRGLTKTKSKNYIELFLKRKSEVECLEETQNHPFLRKSSSRFSRLSMSTKNISCLVKEEKQDILKNLDYIALLRYKDENFIRLKEHEFKSLFIRPVQANQKYKIYNNAHYLQLIPHQVNYLEGTVLNIEFNLEKQKHTELFQKAIQKHTEETSFHNEKQSTILKEKILSINVEAYLLYIIFEIFAYVNIHYHKHIKEGSFEFMKVNDKYYLSNVKNLKLDEGQTIKNEYAREDLFEDFVEVDQMFDLNHERAASGVVRAVEEIFDNSNKKICEDVRSFVKNKLAEIENKPDVVESNNIFKSINDKCSSNLHELFSNDRKYEKFLKNKEKELDGMSPLTSISNICRNKYPPSQTALQQTPSRRTVKVESEVYVKENIFRQKMASESNLIKPKHGQFKWFVQTLRGKREYKEEKKF